ncbi:unnamed protein product [Soboliphyme baturini]|uniref:STAS domain-containing protein n=1 Tax=Soboliphyme baturini TaxID=241478 RepID=A0A183IPH0_9BILA|nr:unnamed protein product [Soboliphyme baturini]
MMKSSDTHVSRTEIMEGIGAVLVYDITDTYSFAGLGEHLNEIKRAMFPDAQISVAGSKADLDMLRKVSFQEAHTFAVEHYLSLFEVSAKTGKNVLELFQDLVGSILKKHTFEVYSPVSLEVVNESMQGSGSSLMPCCWI